MPTKTTTETSASETTPTEAPTKREFETETCSRCAGSGQYSYCQMYGTTCFKCRGKRITYTKRAQAALAYARELRTVPADDIQVGWLIWMDSAPMGGWKAGWYTVREIREKGFCATIRTDENGNRTEHWHRDIVVRHPKYGESGIGWLPGTGARFQAVPNKERLAAILELALDYQDTLTKQGTPRKAGKKGVA